MSTVRLFLLRHRWLAMWLVFASLLMKVLVPAGFMPTVSDGTIMVRLCTDMGVETVAMKIPGLADEADAPDHIAADQPCAFSGLSMPGLAGADPVLLAIAIAFIIAAARRPAPLTVTARHIHLRPPSQGPPVTA